MVINGIIRTLDNVIRGIGLGFRNRVRYPVEGGHIPCRLQIMKSRNQKTISVPTKADAMRRADAKAKRVRLWKNGGPVRFVAQGPPEGVKLPPDGTTSPNVRFGS